MIVDWRNRFGRNWITSVRDQGGSENCWVFACNALFEAMIRIEHHLWTRRSEGDLGRGTGKQPWDSGNVGEGAIFVERYGLADPDCMPWSEHAVLYTAKPHGAALVATPLSTTPDRAGRTVRVSPGNWVWIEDLNEKKIWIDLVGPMAVSLSVPNDFFPYHGGIYRPASPADGAHALLVVGYNDPEEYWIVKNSWGAGWGENGFMRISYGANLLERNGFVGVKSTNPDPWSRRRLRNGALVQGGNGAQRNNFELFIKAGNNVDHWFRDNGTPNFPWHRVGPVRSTDIFRDSFHDDVDDAPAVVQSTFNRDFEIIYRTTLGSEGDGRLRHVYYDQSNGLWSDMKFLGFPGTKYLDIPAFIQSNRGAPGDFEVVVVNATGLAEHWTKHNSCPWNHLPGQWYFKESFGRTLAHGGPALVQSRLGVVGAIENGAGELHFVCATKSGQLQHWKRSRPDATGWSLLTTFGNGVDSGPCMIEGTYGMQDESGIGNFELCVAVGGKLEHWWRGNNPAGQWNRSAVLDAGARRVLSLVQSTFQTNLEVIIERLDGRIQHYWRDSAGWHPGAIIV